MSITNFWRREKKIVETPLGPVFAHIFEPKKEFTQMFGILKDAEFYDNKGDAETRNALLKRLIECADKELGNRVKNFDTPKP